MSNVVPRPRISADALLQQAPWLVTLAWVALMILKTLVVTHGSLVTAIALLGGSNLFSAAVSAAASLFWTALMVAVATGPVMLVVVQATGGRRQFVFWLVAGWIVATILLLLTAPLILDIAAAIAIPVSFAFVFGLGAVLWVASDHSSAVHGAARRVRSLPRRSKVEFVLAYYLALVVVQVATSGPWLQPERVTVAGHAFVGYYVAEDSGWTVFLEEQTRQTRLVKTTKIKSRQICWLQSQQFDRTLAFTFGGSPPRYLPDCR